MIEKYYVDVSGNYLGTFVFIDDVTPPADGIEVSTPPPHGKATWNGTSWDDPDGPERSRKLAIQYDPEMPTDHDIVMALIEGGQALADIKILINSVNARYPAP